MYCAYTPLLPFKARREGDTLVSQKELLAWARQGSLSHSKPKSHQRYEYQGFPIEASPRQKGRIIRAYEQLPLSLKGLNYMILLPGTDTRLARSLSVYMGRG